MNPNQIINMLISRNPQMQNNPIIKNAMQLMQTGNTQGLQTMAQNLAREKGIDIDALKQQIESNLQIKI